MTRVELPHFAFPFARQGSSVAVVEQDSDEDVSSCVGLVLSYPIGSRAELPEFGRPDSLFEEAPVDTEGLAAAIEQWEPRTSALLSEDPAALVDAVERIRVALEGAA